MAQVTQAVIVGGGRMGADIALVLARGGCRSFIIESSAQRRDTLPGYFDGAGKGQAWRECITVSGNWSEAPWAMTQLAVECVTEDLQAKQEVFAELVRQCGRDTLITSNSSSLPISAIADGHATAERMLGWHFFHPANVVPLVEVISGPETADASAEKLVAFSRQCRLVPIRVHKDVPGFVANRLQHAMAREAYALVESGVVSAEDVDRAVRFGFGFRYLAAGPFLQRDHGGLDVHAAAAAAIFPTLASEPVVPRLVLDRVAAGKTGIAAGEGFFRWTPEQAAAERERYRRVLEKTLSLLAEDSPLG
jgi:3-hydroxybutyryl-CoA dehydrogenase